MIKKTFHNKPFQWRKLCFGKKPAPPLPALFFLAALMALAAFSGCDLLDNKPEIDLEKALDDEIVWANAARLTVTVAVPEGWGTSPQMGVGRAGDTRQGYAFTVEFYPNTAWNFAGWYAFRTSEYAGAIDTKDLSGALNGTRVLLTPGTTATGAYTASVIINTTEPLTLVPWCEERPRITQSNPPLINNGYSYSRGQQIRIWFATALDPSTVTFGEGHIEISGLTIGDSSEPYDDPDTGGVNEEGDLTGRKAGASRFFYDPVWDDSTKTISIRPGDGVDGTKLPPGDLMITVAVGTNVKSPNGNGMASPVDFYYRTNTLELKNVYTAENIWAIHRPADSPAAEDFFYSGADTSRDRRLRKNDSGNYEVTLYFTVQASNPTEMTDPPGKFTIAELRYANLMGDTVMTLTEEGSCTAEAVENDAGSAGQIYRQNNSGGTFYYKIRYEWTTPPSQPGIIRLIVLPYRDQDGDGDYSDAGDFAPDTWTNAHAEGRFAAVVLDDQPPSGDAGLMLSGEASVDGGVHNYSNTAQNKNLNITTDFSNVADNGGFGIRQMAASLDKPWTMDDPGDLKWQWRIVTGQTQNWPANNDAWHPFSDTTQPLDLSTVTSLDANTRRDVQVRFRDSLGNINTADEGWIAMGTIVYYTPTYSPVTKWGADYSETANSITVTWTTPAGMTGVELSVNGGGAQQITGTGEKTHAITGVPKIDASGVPSGQSVTGVTGYTVTLTAYNAYGKAAPVTVKIWNIPGMSVSNTSPAIEIRDNENDNNDSDGTISLKRMALNNANKKYVLMNDITLTGTWTPIGTGETNAFTGTFYGNGHTIRGVTPAGGVQHMGLFGCVKNAEIRDLCVEYTGAISPSSSYPYVGGIVGRAYGSTKILNCLSKGNLTINKSSSCSGSAVGGIAGALETGSVIIQNSYGGLNLTVNMTLIIDQTLRSIRVGGLAGYAGYGSSVKASTVRGNMDITSNREINAGGVAGYAEGSSLTASTVWGNLTVDNTGTGEVRAGGLAGYAGTGSSLTASTVRGNMDITASGQIYVGGVAGYVVGSDGSLASIEDCVYETGTIRGTTSTTSYTCYLGGIIGYVPRYAKVSNCYSRAGRITATVSTGNLHFGGFAGYMQNITVSDCGSSSPLALTGTPRGRVGGFAGQMTDGGAGVKLERCWATGDVNAQATGSFAAGGLVGEIYDDSPGDDNGDCKIINCYATGNVNVVSTNTSTAENAGAFVVGGLLGMALSAEISESWASGKVSAWRTTNGRIFAGGLVGSLGAYHTQEAQHDHLRSSISDCYALGDVLADNSYDGASSATQVYAGGLAGNVYIDSNNKIEHSFAAGSVTAQSFGTGATVYAGGVMGYKWTAAGALSNTAALGEGTTIPTIFAAGGGTRSANRVYAYSAGGTHTNNYALGSMRIGTGSSHDAVVAGSIPTGDIGANAKNGANTAAAVFRTQNFWTSTLDFSTNTWSFTYLAGKGYPLLKNAGGQ